MIFRKKKKSRINPALVGVDLPSKYRFLLYEKSPKILIESLKLHGTLEVKGAGNNPVILGWAKEVGGWIGRFYDKDSIPWCGLYIALLCKRAGLPYNQKALSALSWAAWGEPVDVPMLGDILTFTRKGGGHVGLYVGEDETHYHVHGGNQSDSVSFTRIAKTRFYEARRTKWKWSQPKNIRRIFLDGVGRISENEA